MKTQSLISLFAASGEHVARIIWPVCWPLERRLGGLIHLADRISPWLRVAACPGDNQFRRQRVSLLHRHLLEASVAQAVCLVVSGVKGFVGIFHHQKKRVNEEEGLCNKSIPILK